jgi:FkbM family methyltransferase
LEAASLEELTVTALASMSRAEAEAAIRARVQTVYLGNDQVLCRVLGRPKMFLSARDLGFSCHVMLDGYWEIWLTLFFARAVTPGMTVMDIGANLGYYTVLLGNAVGPSGHVIAIEPVPQTAALLKKTIALNGMEGWVRLITAAAVGPQTSAVEMYVPENEPKNAAIIGTPIEGAIQVPAVSVDELTRGLSRLDLVKIDAEGAEMLIIDGMRETIKRLRPNLLLEFNAHRYRDPSAFLEILLWAYPQMRALDFFGGLQPVTAVEVLGRQSVEDWLLYFSQE